MRLSDDSTSTLGDFGGGATKPRRTRGPLVVGAFAFDLDKPIQLPPPPLLLLMLLMMIKTMIKMTFYKFDPIAYQWLGSLPLDMSIWLAYQLPARRGSECLAAWTCTVFRARIAPASEPRARQNSLSTRPGPN